jgi:hypothetical protein
MFCNKMKAQMRLLLNQFDKYLEAHVDTALQVSTLLKNALTSPVADWVTALIPTRLDDVLKKQLSALLDKVIDTLAIVDACKQYTDLNQKLDCFAKQLKAHDPELRDALLQKLAGLLAAGLDGQRLQQYLYDLYTQAKYSASK